MSEYDGDNWGTNYPDWMGLAVTMHNVFALEEANAYLVWSLYYGLLYNANGSPATDNYYTVGHYSKFIDPYDWRIDSATSDPNILTTVYVHDTGPTVSSRYTVLLINTTNYTSMVTLSTSNLWSGDVLQRSWQVYKTANEGPATFRLTLVESAGGASLTNQNESITLPPYSLATAVINNGIDSNPTNLNVSSSNQMVALNWPADHLGWILQTQTNQMNVGLGTNWIDVPGTSNYTQAVFPVSPVNSSVFFQLRHP